MQNEVTTFVLELHDHQAMTTHVCAPTTAPSKKRSMIVTGVGLTVVVLVALSFVDSFNSFVLGMVVTSAFLFVVVKIATAGVRKQLEPRPGGSILCEYGVALTPDGMSIRTKHWESTTRWSAVLAIDETSEHIFFKLDSIAAYTVPKRAFPDADACRRFVERARSYLRTNA